MMYEFLQVLEQDLALYNSMLDDENTMYWKHQVVDASEIGYDNPTNSPIPYSSAKIWPVEDVKILGYTADDIPVRRNGIKIKSSWACMIADMFIWDSCYNLPASHKFTLTQGIKIQIPEYVKTKDNYIIYKYIENKYSTNLTSVRLNKLIELYPELFIVELKNNQPEYYINMSIDIANSYFTQRLETLLDKGHLYIPDNINKEDYVNNLQINARVLFDEYKLRESYLRNPKTDVAQQYFHDLIINYRYKLADKLENEYNPNLNKSNILKMLLDNNKYDYIDFTSYRWQDQLKTFWWSLQDKTSNSQWFKSKETDFCDIYEKFNKVKNDELVKLSKNPTEDINSSKKIGNNVFNQAIPANYLVGILQDDALNSANIKTKSILSQITYK